MAVRAQRKKPQRELQKVTETYMKHRRNSMENHDPTWELPYVSLIEG